VLRIAEPRLNWGCGATPEPGWLNSDRVAAPGVALCCDIRDGLPLPDACMQYAVAMHALQDVPWYELRRAASELRRVLREDGVLRVGVPDLDRAIDAYRRGDAAYFYVPDHDAVAIGAKLVTQIVWYGSVRTPFTFDFAGELLHGSGFSRVERCAFRLTSSRFADIVALDNRERETLFLEAYP
jgi:predicted SAM-dependent methyltransferase